MIKKIDKKDEEKIVGGVNYRILNPKLKDDKNNKNNSSSSQKSSQKVTGSIGKWE